MGRLFTNNQDNISIVSNRRLVPRVSWQYFNGKVVKDCDNLLLTKSIPVNSIPKRIDGHLVSLLCGGGGANYYHWLFDCLPRLRVVQGAIALNSKTKYLIPDAVRSFHMETLQALGIAPESCVSSRSFSHVVASNLIATSYPNADPTEIPEWIVNFLRESFLETGSSDLPSGLPRLIYISRQDSPYRNLLNEDELVQPLMALGFNVYSLASLSFKDQVGLFRYAKMIIGVHGAGMANLVFAPRGAVVYEIFSECFQPCLYEKLSLINGLQYNKVVCSNDAGSVRSRLDPAAQSPLQLNMRISRKQIGAIVDHARLIAQ